MQHGRRRSLLAVSVALVLAAGSSSAQPNAFEDPLPETTVDPVISPVAYQGGTVVLRVAVAEDGTVTAVEVVKPFPALTDAVVAAVDQWRFKPATLNGRNVAASTTVAVHVALIRTVAPPPGRP